MKQLLITAVVLLFALPSTFGQHKGSNTFTIEGKIRNFGNGMLVGTIKDPTTQSILLDTIVVSNGTFKHSSNVNTKQIIQYVTTGDQFAKYRKVRKDGDSVLVDFAEEQSKSIEIVASPGSTIVIDGIAKTYLDAYPSGTDENVKLAKLNRKIYPLLDQLGSLDYRDKNTIRSVLKTEETLRSAISDAELEFIENNPKSIVSSYLVWKKFELLNKRDTAKADSLFGLIQPGKSDLYHQQILALQQNRTKQKVELAVGEMFPDFATKFVHKGQLFSLDQTKGKYTLIDFWGSWCIPCVKEMPKLKAYDEKYRGKLQIVGIANDKYQNWKAFLDKNEYDWIQVLDEGIPKLSDRLAINVYPTKYLLDPTGKVIRVFKDSNDELWDVLDKLLETTPSIKN